MPNETHPSNDMPDMEAMLRQAAQDSDAGKAVDLSALTASAPKDTPANTETPAESTTLEAHSQAPEAGAAKPDNQQAKQTPAGDKKDAKPADPAAQSDFAKKQAERDRKDQERFDRNWKKLQERQAEIEERERRLAERERSTTTRATERAPQKPANSDYTPDQWERAAQTWEKQGKFELAEAAREKAEELRKQPPTDHARAAANERSEAPATAPEETPGTPQFEAKWNENLHALVTEHAELKDTKSEIYRATAEVLRSDPRFSRFNDGIRAAFEIATLRLKAGKVDQLEAKLKEQDQELTKLRQATQPGGGNIETAPKAKAFEDMSTTEQEAYLQKLAAQES